MPHLRLQLFGAPLLETEVVPVETGQREAIAVLAYLAVTRQPHTREILAALLYLPEPIRNWLSVIFEPPDGLRSGGCDGSTALLDELIACRDGTALQGVRQTFAGQTSHTIGSRRIQG